MQTALTTRGPVARLSTTRKIALGSALAAIGGASIMLSLMLGWNELARPWSFIIGFAGGLTGGAGVALALCGLLQCAREARGHAEADPGSSARRSGGQTQ
jgi:hypothetical protein